jgi:hypothetical protein
MAAGMVVAIMWTDLQRELAVGGRHEAGRYHRLKEQRDQQRAGDERTITAMSEVSRHRTMELQWGENLINAESRTARGGHFEALRGWRRTR